MGTNYSFKNLTTVTRSVVTLWNFWLRNINLVLSKALQCLILIIHNDIAVVLCAGVKLPGRTSDHSPPSRAETKHDWRCVSAPSVCLHHADRDNLVSYKYCFQVMVPLWFIPLVVGKFSDVSEGRTASIVRVTQLVCMELSYITSIYSIRFSLFLKLSTITDIGKVTVNFSLYAPWRQMGEQM
jgi:hypothetical protein